MNMNPPRELLCPCILLMTYLSVMTGCAAPSEAAHETWALPSDFEFTISNGQDDLRNKYRSVVMVSTERGLCSGTLMTQNLVLTAAHCVCLPAPQVTDQRVDNSNCAANATVVAHSYEVEAGQVKSTSRSFHGKAFAYPGFKAVIHQGRVASFEGDLAVVRLNEPVTGVKIDFRLPVTEVLVDESLTMVGFGDTQPQGKDAGRRRFGQNVVTSIVLESGGNGLFAFRSPGTHSQSGDSGGPCFREDKKGSRWVVGINSGHANAGTISLFTSTFHYRAWITEQLRKVDTD